MLRKQLRFFLTDAEGALKFFELAEQLKMATPEEREKLASELFKELPLEHAEALIEGKKVLHVKSKTQAKKKVKDNDKKA